MDFMTCPASSFFKTIYVSGFSEQTTFNSGYTRQPGLLNGAVFYKSPGAHFIASSPDNSEWWFDDDLADIKEQHGDGLFAFCKGESNLGQRPL